MEFTGNPKPLPVTPPIIPAEAKSIDDAAAKKAKEEERKAGKGQFNPDWLRLALAAGGGLIGHSLVSSMLDGKTDEEKRRESIWTKLLSAILPIGAAGLGAWGGYALGGQLKNAADGKDGKNASNGPMGTEVIMDGKSYSIHPDLTNTLSNIAKGYVPGMKSTELQFAQEKGNREMSRLGRDELMDDWVSRLLGWGAWAPAGMGAWHGAMKGIEKYTDKGVNKTLIDNENAIKADAAAQNEMQDLRGRIEKLNDRATRAEDAAAGIGQANGGKKGGKVNVTKATEIQNKSLNNAAALERELAAAKAATRPAPPPPMKVQRAIGASEAARATGAKGKIGHGTKSLGWLAASGLMLGLSQYADYARNKAIEEQNNIRAALDQLAAQSNAAPASVQSPVQ